MSELAQAYHNSCATYEYRRVQVPHGMFAVIEESIAFCPITDATLPGSNHYLVRLCGTRRVADYYAAKHAAKMYGDDGHDGEVRVAVLPRAPLPPRPARDPGLDDIPF